MINLDNKQKVRVIYHMADIHIRTFRYHDEYREVFSELYSSIREKSQELSYYEGRIVIVGDVFHQKINISNESLILCSEFFNELAEIHPLIIAPGNHDMLENNHDRLDSITPVVKLIKNPNIHYLTESISTADSNIVWANYSIIEKRRIPEVPEKTKDKVIVGLYHGPIDGSKTDIGFAFEGATDNTIFTCCDVVMCGDIHKRQEITQGDVKIVMPGSLIQQDFGETISSHGYLAWDVDTLTYVAVDVRNDSTYVVYEVTSVDDIDNNAERLING